MQQSRDPQRSPQVLVETRPLGDEQGIASYVLRVPLRVAVLRVDGDDQARQDVEGASLGSTHLVARRIRDPHPVAATRLRLAECHRGDRQQLSRRIAVDRREAQASTDRHGQPFRAAELKAQVDQPAAEALDRRLQVRRALRRRDQEEFVGSVAAECRVLREFGAQKSGDLEEPRVTGAVAVGVVQQPEVVDVDQGNADRPQPGAACLAPGFELGRKVGDHGSMVEQAREGVASSGFHELPGLPSQPALRRAEDQVQQDGQDHRCRHGDHDCVPTRHANRGEQLRGIPVDLEHRDHAWVGFGGQVLFDGQVFLEHHRRAKRVLVALFAGPSGGHVRKRRPAECLAEVVLQTEVLAGDLGYVAEQHGAVGTENLDPERPGLRIDKIAQPRLDLHPTRAVDAAQHKIGRLQLLGNEGTDERGIRVDARLERRIGDVYGYEGRQRQARDYDERQARCEDQEQELRASTKTRHRPYRHHSPGAHSKYTPGRRQRRDPQAACR